ncbi:MAG: nucleotidyltransferase domain-containing protein [Candidatus Hydrogenedentes bacterium]|nr:nucleotidyltransferase domain-containing protein [Candidatus Hydrogenedentota bacterium]
MAPVVAIDSELNRVVDIIVDTVHPKRIILFGSRARGDSRQGSDVDLLVLLPNDSPYLNYRVRTIGNILRKMKDISFAEDLLLYSEEEFERLKESDIHVLGTAAREGLELYAGS